MFLWGVGNSVAPGLAELLRLCEQPEVLFSPIRVRPRPVDVSPAATFVWTAGEGLDGSRYEVPETIRSPRPATSTAGEGVLSRAHPICGQLEDCQNSCAKRLIDVTKMSSL